MNKIRVIINNVTFYTTRTSIKRQTSGDNTLQNCALYHALDFMGKNTGCAKTVRLYDSRMKQHVYDIQLTVV